jgi:anti-sigma B factor antagonist
VDESQQLLFPEGVSWPSPDIVAQCGLRRDTIEFRVDTRTGDMETFVVFAQGDVDCVTAPELEQELLETVKLGRSRVLVDLTEATYFGSSAIHALMRARERLQASGLELAVVCGNPTVRKVFQITGIDQAMRIHSADEQTPSWSASVLASLEPSPAMSHANATNGYA